MRILSWNINGVRTLPQYHPWNTLKTCQAILQHLQADIICFQEMKITRSALDDEWAVSGQFDSFFSFPTNKGGYSGVAVYTDSRLAVPVKAEEGITGKLQSKLALRPEERISLTYPSANDLDLMPDEDGNTPSDLAYLDAEGRALVLDFGLFVLINTYCPNLTSDARMAFKMNFIYTLHERVRILIQEGREVIVLGDLNICSTPLDHADGSLASNASKWYDERPDRIWLRKWIDETEGCMVDIVRKFWPERKGMFTCWNTRISARQSNYGARVDYILVTRGLLPWIRYGDIQPSLHGSDHCPIYIDLHDEITTDSGTTLTLREAMHQGFGKREPPRLAAKYWDEFAGRQTSLKAFFGKGNASAAVAPKPSPPSVVPGGEDASFDQAVCDMRTSLSAPAPPEPREGLAHKRKILPSSSQPKVKKQRAEQTKLSNFFSKPSTGLSTSSQSPPQINHEQVDADYHLAVQLASEETMPSSHPDILRDKGKGKAEWGQLLAPIQPPKCIVHREPAKELTVTKNGPNKGKNFFICSRPLGPGYDKGRADRRRDEVDHRYRCDFFKWSSDVKKEALKDKTS